MSEDRETLNFYDSAAEDYARRFGRSDKCDLDVDRFLEAMKSPGLVLDFGCGPGTFGALIREGGHKVEGWDGSEGMVRVARDLNGLDARVALFSDLNAENHYDGIFANFSLLHAPRSEMPDNLKRIYRALKPGGVFHLGLKLGDNEARDRLGRKYTYFTEEELNGLLEAEGFEVIKTRKFKAKGMAGGLEPSIVILSRA